jgi:hypothetical protein
VYKNCNFSIPNCVDDGGHKKGVRLFPGDDTPRTFINCNLINCEPPPNSTLTGCNTAIIDRGVGVSTEDAIEIDGTAIECTQLKDVVYGKYEDGGYTYFPIPKEILHEGMV